MRLIDIYLEIEVELRVIRATLRRCLHVTDKSATLRVAIREDIAKIDRILENSNE